MKPEKQLYQWDVNQYLTGINPSAQYVDYTIGNEVIRLETDGTMCRIPDEVLQTYGGKTCYERYPDGTYRAYSFTVLYAPKPPDYVYTPEERTTFEALTARVDAAIDEIKRRADSGEFTPKKGVDYFTEAEKNELMEGVSSGAVGEFREVVDSATADFNENSSVKTNDYNSNAEKKLSTYNSNAEQKLESYNSNHTEKFTEYNANAETKTAEFDANAAALQTEVDRLRGECDNLAAENRKQENRIDALMKLNKGQTYDILPEEGETASRTAPSGAKYVGIDKVGGKSIVWNQLIDKSQIVKTQTISGVTFRTNDDGTITLNGTAIEEILAIVIQPRVSANHTYLLVGIEGGSDSTYYIQADYFSYLYSGGEITTPTSSGLISVRIGVRKDTVLNNAVLKPQLFDLTQMFGSTIADYVYSLEQSQAGAGVSWFKKLFPADYYPYSEPTIISSQTDRVDVVSADGISQQITTGFPELRSAGTAHDEIDMDGGQVTRNVYTVELETLLWRRSDNKFYAVLPAKAKANGNYNTTNNELCNKYEPIPMNDLYGGNVGIATHSINGETVWIFDSAYETPEQLGASLAGAVLHYELATPTTEPVAIPEAMQEWLPVEAGGTVTFRNSDETKQLAVPNAVSWVRKLDEVN